MYEYKYTVMSSKATKSDQNSQPPIVDKTGNSIYRHKVNQSKCNPCTIDTFLLFSSLACLSNLHHV